MVGLEVAEVQRVSDVGEGQVPAPHPTLPHLGHQLLHHHHLCWSQLAAPEDVGLQHAGGVGAGDGAMGIRSPHQEVLKLGHLRGQSPGQYRDEGDPVQVLVPSSSSADGRVITEGRPGGCGLVLLGGDVQHWYSLLAERLALVQGVLDRGGHDGGHVLVQVEGVQAMIALCPPHLQLPHQTVDLCTVGAGDRLVAG